ncbi:MAG: PQQ-binding-like beta-propeller repeat protein [Planctomycetota bacterium]|nr:PQQ-binding-like beta-propeller repeat protein [Planctomycetota bacterium]
MGYGKPEDMIFVGFNSRVVALDRQNGDVLWQWKAPKGTGYVAVLLDGDRLVVSVEGYTYCLDPATGDEVWFNPLSGTGTGVPCLASARGGCSGSHLLGASDDERRRRAAASGTSAAPPMA